LGQLLHGLGELAARSHESILDLLIAHLAGNSRIRWAKVMASALVQDRKVKSSPDLEILAFSQWLSTATLQWETLANAHARLYYGRDPILCAFYGLTFTACIALAIDARATDEFLRQHPNDRRSAAIGRAAFKIALPYYGGTRPEALLRSRCAAIRCLGAAALLTPFDMSACRLALRECHALFVRAGLSSTDAIWMMGLRLKEAIHEYYRSQSASEGHSERLRHIEQDPSTAHGGERYAAAEAENIKANLDAINARYHASIAHIETTLAEIAELWPSEGLSDAQMQWLEPSFVGKTEFRYRLAEKLPAGPNREELLRRNIKQLQETFGFASDFHQAGKTSPPCLNDREFEETAEWSAKSLCLLYENDSRGVGRRVGILLDVTHKAAVNAMAQPFLSARKPEYWANLLSSAAYAYRFALVAVHFASAIPGSGALLLRDLALSHTFTLLTYGQISSRARTLFFRLTMEALRSLKDLPDPEVTLEQWAVSEALPLPARALALWSSPALVDRHRALAYHLFLQTGLLPSSRSEFDLALTQLINLADTAIAAASRSERQDLIQEVVAQWDKAYESWMPITRKWSNCAAKLAMAVTNEGPDRHWLLEELAFSNSACTTLVKS
jgi:hypothetical protein